MAVNVLKWYMFTLALNSVLCFGYFFNLWIRSQNL